jgi:hypothetical protein
MAGNRKEFGGESRKEDRDWGSGQPVIGLPATFLLYIIALAAGVFILIGNSATG